MVHKLQCLLILTLCAGLLSTGTSSALSGSDWQVGRIIDDSVFTDKNSMTVDQIQAFLNTKVGTGGYGKTAGQCDTIGSANSEYGDGTRANYGNDHGNPSPFTCLKDYYEVPKTAPGPGMPANNYGGKPIPSGAESAAQLIWDAAQRNNISPKVLLVTIQKESAGPLTTDDWPFASQYTYAMGAHCPDTGPGGSANCDPDYAGFSIQISESAALLRYYLDNMNQPWWTYKKIGSNSIQYNPATSCGSSTVNIVTMATAALYTYTPYQPNAAALSDLYGSGDGCSAFGNRNFWRIFNSWFGSPVGPDYQATISSNKLYVDAARTQTVPQIRSRFILTPGQKVYATVNALNSGRAVWDNYGNLGTTLPHDRPSVFQGSDWLTPQRPATLSSNPISPGSVGTFNFSMTAPTKTGSYNENFSVVIDGKTWTNALATFPIDISTPDATQLSPAANTLSSTGNTTALTTGSTLLSSDGYTSLTLDIGGYLTLRNDFQSVWTPNVSAGVGGRLVLQTDGNLVLYTKGDQPVWNSATSGKGTSMLYIQEDGNMALDNSSGATWASATAQPIGHNNYVQSALTPGSIMYARQSAQTADRKLKLTMQSDGNLVLYSPDKPLWATNTVGSGATTFAVQTDGNLVLYTKDNKPVWSSRTNGSMPSQLAVQTDGNLVLYGFSGPLWLTNSLQPLLQSDATNSLTGGQKLTPGQYLTSDNLQYKLLLQTDGNLVLYDFQNRASWSSGTSNRPVVQAVVQSDGNVVLYDSSGKVYWSAGTGGHGSANLILQDDGHLKLYSSTSRILWTPF
jgi:hypothetical protein